MTEEPIGRSPIDFPPEEELQEEPQEINGNITDITNLLLISKDTPDILVYLYIYVQVGDPPKISVISPRKVPEFVETGLEEHEVESLWSIPTRLQMEEYRRNSSSFNIQANSVMIDEILLCDQVVSNHLWSIRIDGKEMELSRNQSTNKISGPTLRKLKSFHSGFYDTLYTSYRMESCLTM